MSIVVAPWGPWPGLLCAGLGCALSELPTWTLIPKNSVAVVVGWNDAARIC